MAAAAGAAMAATTAVTAGAKASFTAEVAVAGIGDGSVITRTQLCAALALLDDGCLESQLYAWRQRSPLLILLIDRRERG